MARVRPAMILLSALVTAAVGGLGLVRGRPRRATEIAPEPGAEPGEGQGERAVRADEARAVPGEAVPWGVGHLDRALATLGTIGALGTVGLLVWEVTGQTPPLPASRGPSWPFVALLGTLVVWAVYLFWKVPQWQAAGRRGENGVGTKELFDIENAARGTLGQMLSGVAVIAGLLFAWQQLGNTADTLRMSQEGQITERFTRAVDQLGSDDLTIRLGGIYGLERLARDSEREEGPIAEVLAAFVREHAPLGEPGAAMPTPGTGPRGVPVDVQAVLTVLGGPEAPRDVEGCLDLRRTDLSGADLAGANLAGACLDGTNLAGAGLTEAVLEGAILSGANLAEARLDGAKLKGAFLDSARLMGADLTGADLTGADLLTANATGTIMHGTILRGANLNGADLSGAVLFGADLTEAILTDANLTMASLLEADLTGAVGLTGEQVDAAVIDRRTRLPADVRATPDI